MPATTSARNRIRLGVGLLRVSTDRQFQEGESIESQQRKVEFVARRDGVDIVRFFVEHYSGRKTDRKVLDEVFAFLRENKDVETAIVGDIDRFTRGGSEVYLALRRELRALGVALVDTTGIIQPERNRLEHLGVEYQWSIDSPSRFAEVFMAEKARAEAADILTRTIGQQIQLTRDGYQCRVANYGYRNIKIATDDGKKKTTMVPDESEAVFIRRMFELKADNSWRDEDICDTVNAMGYRSRTQNIYDQTTRRVIGQTTAKRLTPKQLNKYISRTIYCGVRCEKWNQDKPVMAPVEPLISIDLFNRANRGKLWIEQRQDGSLEIQENRNPQERHRHNPEFLLRHVVLCPICGKPFWASKSRGRRGGLHGFFHCNRNHKYFGVSQSEFENTIAKYLDDLQAKPGFLDLFRELVRDVWIQKNRSRGEERAQIDQHICELAARQSALLDRVASCKSALVQEKLEQQIEELEAVIKKTTARRADVDISEGEIEAYFQRAKDLLEHPTQHVLSAQTKEQLTKIWGFIFRSRPTWAQITSGTPELTLIYRLNAASSPDKNLLAGQLDLHWNLFIEDVKWANSPLPERDG